MKHLSNAVKLAVDEEKSIEQKLLSLGDDFWRYVPSETCVDGLKLLRNVLSGYGDFLQWGASPKRRALKLISDIEQFWKYHKELNPDHFLERQKMWLDAMPEIVTQ